MKTIIETEEENRIALMFVERLMGADPETKEGQLLKLLVEHVVEFEKRYDLGKSLPA